MADDQQERTATKRTVKSYCRNCSALCSMELEIAGERLVGAGPDGSVSPYGAYMCPKGLEAVAFHNGAEARLHGSLRRTADGGFAPIDNAQALIEIGTKLRAILDEHGPRAIATYHGTGAYRSTLGNLMQRAFADAIGTPNFFSSMTIDQSSKWVTMGRMGLMACGKPDTADVDLAVFVGNNPLVSHQTAFAAGDGGAPARSYAALKARGGRIIVIDPRRTETARFADLLIQPIPGNDAAVFAAIAHILFRDGTWQRTFTDRFATEVDDLRRAVAPFTPTLAAARAGITAGEIETAAAWIGAAERPYIGTGTGPAMSDHSNLADHLIEAVNALVGGYRRAGDRVRNPGTLKPRRLIEMAVAPNRTWEREPKIHSADIGPIMNEYPTSLLPQAILTPGPDRIRALIVLGGNPAMAVGDPARAVPGFAALDLLVTIDPRLNETAGLSHYVLAASQMFERHDITFAGDGAFPEAFAQYAPPVVAKPEGTLHDWEAFWGIAAQMGVALTIRPWNYGLTYGAIPSGLALPTDTAPDPEAMIAFLCNDSRVPFDELRASPSGVRPVVADSFVEAAPAGHTGRLHLCPPDVAAELAALAGEAADTRFAYRLTCRRVLEAMNSAYRDAARALKRQPVNYAHMHPADMAESGIGEGSRIAIESADGAIVAIAKAEARLRQGVISMSHLYGSLSPATDPIAQRGSNVGHLTSLDRWLEPINYMPRFSAIPVNVRPIDGDPA